MGIKRIFAILVFIGVGQKLIAGVESTAGIAAEVTVSSTGYYGEIGEGDVLGSATATIKLVLDNSTTDQINFYNTVGLSSANAYIEIHYDSQAIDWGIEIWTNNTGSTDPSGQKGGLCGVSY
ncbi:MAG: hypothetical protein QME68_00680, partial [Elusimicrobiota bacterium]|nr:hypothetical protein [Elusimicrobiota bacterium]